MRIVQILGDGIEELWSFPDGVTDEEIKETYKRFQNQEDYEIFEEYVDEYNPQMNAYRVFVDEIYV